MTLLDEGTLSVLLTGNTHYVALDAGGEAVIHYTADQRSHMRLPGGQFLKGRWVLSGDSYRTDWEDGPKGHWYIDHAPGCFAYVDGEQQRRGVVSRIVPGDPEAFAG